jgi:hypothetical protein
MPTNPPKTLYDPAAAAGDVQPLVDEACPVLQEVIDQGMATLARCSHTATGGQENNAAFITFHHLLEMLDSACELLRSGRSVGARLPLRAAFELFLGLKFLLEDSSMLKPRAYAFLVAEVHDRLDWNEMRRPGTKQRARFEEAWRRDEWTRDQPFLEYSPGADEERCAYLALLKEPGEWKKAEGAWRKAKGRHPRWYALNDGPETLRQLATELGHPAAYELLYSMWSKTSHGADTDRILQTNPQGKTTLARIPCAEYTRQNLLTAMNLGLAAIHIVLRFYRDEEQFFADWYVREIRETFQKIAQPFAPPAPTDPHQ